MAMSKLEAIMDCFTRYGKQDTPVAIIQNGTTPQQKMVLGTVRDICFRSQHAGLSNPAVIVIGEVVTLASALQATQLLSCTHSDTQIS